MKLLECSKQQNLTRNELRPMHRKIENITKTLSETEMKRVFLSDAQIMTTSDEVNTSGNFGGDVI